MCQFLFEKQLFEKTDRNGNLQVLCICVFRFDSATHFNIMFDITNINTLFVRNIKHYEKRKSDFITKIIINT